MTMSKGKGKGYKRKKRRMRKFYMDEIASVDRPAQDPALAVIMKRGAAPEGEPFSKSPDETPYVMTSSVEDHAHGVWIYGKGGETSYHGGTSEDTHSHPWMMRDGRLVIGEANGHVHEVDETAIMMAFTALMKREYTSDELELLAGCGFALEDGTFPVVTSIDVRNAVEDLEKAADQEAAILHIRNRAQALNIDDPFPTVEDDMPDDITKQLQADNEALKAQVATLTALGTLTDVQKAHYNSLSEQDQATFLAKSSSDRDAELADIAKRAADSDPVVFTAADGTEFRKSHDPLLVKMARERDEDRKELAKLRASSVDDTFAKRADAEIPSLPGTARVRGAILKALGTIDDEDLRKEATQSVVAGSKAVEAALNSVGTSTGASVISDAEAELEKRANTYMAANPGTDFYTAYDAVSNADPTLAKRALNKE